MNPLVSIIIPLYNRETLLSETLESILNQSYKHWECLIIDDHSTDNSFNIAEQFVAKDNRFKVLKRPKNRNKGANACRNYGFENSNGTFVNWFDSDDIMHHSFLTSQIKEIHNTDYDTVICKTLIFKESIKTIIGKESRTKLTDNLLSDFIKLNIAWYLQAVIWKKSFLNDKELFDEDLLAGQDRDFHTRILLHQPSIIINDEFLFYYRKHTNSITANIDNIKNVKLKTSHLYSMAKLADKLDVAGKLSKDLKLFLFSSMIKYLPFVIKNKTHYRVLKKLLKRLTVFNFLGIINWFKFYLSYTTFKIFGKGSIFLK